MEWLLFVVAFLFTLAGLVCLALTLLSVPGGWIMLVLALVIEFIDGLYLPPERAQTFGWWVLGASTGVLLLGELVEFVAGAAGAKHGGGSRRGMIGALLGGIAGAILATIFLPVPFVGTLIGAVVGTFAGAVIGETTGAAPKSYRGSMKPAIGATIGRLSGTFGKVLLTIVVWATLCVAVWWP